jgi:hypothetical protein
MSSAKQILFLLSWDVPREKIHNLIHGKICLSYMGWSGETFLERGHLN